MINIASIYHFSLLQRISEKQKLSILWVQSKIEQYLSSEGLQYTIKKRTLWEYELVCFVLEGQIWNIQFFHRTKRKREMYFFPYMFCEIYLDKNYIQSPELKKKAIFLLSNIFECFDEFEEKNLLIQFHKDIQKAYNNNKSYALRHDFMNINSLSEIYRKKDISSSIQKFIQKNSQMYTMSSIKNKFPKVYQTLLFFVYNIFALEKSLISTNQQIQKIRSFQAENDKNLHISLSEERLKLNQKSLEKTLKLYKTNFEYFVKIMTEKR